MIISTDQLQMHQDEGAQHGVMTGSGAYREYPQGMVSISYKPTEDHVINPRVQ